MLPVSAVSGEIRVETGKETTVSLYLIGTWEKGGYRLLDSYGGGKLSFDDILSDQLATTLAERAEGGVSRKTVQGVVEFSDLQEGLYLVSQTNEQGFIPFLVSLPWDGDQWQVQITTRGDSPQTGDQSGVRISAIVMLFTMVGLLVVGSRKKC